MSYPVYTVPAGDVLPIMFDTFDGGTGASITMTGLAVTDIEIYKDGGVTQRASDAGYTLLDTDGIDFDGTTGIHGFSINTGDNTDAGFYTVGAWFHVVVSAITVDAQTVSFIAAAFRIMESEGTAGVPDVNVSHISDDSAAADNLEAILDGTLVGPYAALGIAESGTAQSATATTLVGRAAQAIADNAAIGMTLAALGSTQGYWQTRQITDYDLATDTFTVDAWTTTPSGTITYIVFLSAPGSTSSPAPVDVTKWAGSTVATPSVSGVPEVDVTHTAGSVQASIATQASVDDLPTNAELATALAAADDAVLAAIAALENLSAAEVNAEVVDALATDTYAEPGQGSPAATATLAVKLGYLYKAWRNRSTQTATEYALYADDGTTKDHEAACSDDATTFVRGEVATGA